MPHPPFENALLAAWRETCGRRGDAPAVLAADGTPLRTFREIEAETSSWQAEFSGLAPHQVVAVQLGNAEMWPAVILSLLRAGLIPLPLGRHLERADLQAALDLTGAAALVRREGVQALSGRGTWPGTEFLKLTSGTTGAPRAVRFQARHLVADGDHICDTMQFGEEDLNFGAIPLSHSYGFSNLLVPLLCRGVAMAVTEDRLPRAILAGLEATGATVFPGMPVFFDKLAALESASTLPHLRLCLSAGAPLPSAVACAFHQRYGRKIHTFYGSSECGGIAYDASDDIASPEGSLGTPLRGVAATPLADGRIEVRSTAVADGYLPAEEGGALSAGAFTPGDLIRWEGERLILAGRVSDIINIAGRKLNPGEVEAQLQNVPGLRQAVIFGVPSLLRGEEVVLCAAGDGLTRAGLQRSCQEHLSAWQVPRDFWIVPEIPISDRGKISRRALAAQYLAAQSGPPSTTAAP